MKLRNIFWVAVGLLVSVVLGVRYFDRLAPVNETTKTCLITGASSGIGQHLAIEMIKRGWKVIAIARRANVLAQLSQTLGETSFIPYICDVGNREQVRSVSDHIKAQGLKPTLFFLNAGTGEREELGSISTDVHEWTFAVNYFGAIAWVEEWLPLVKQWGGGSFIATSSVMAFGAAPGASAYGASKAALGYSFKSLRLQHVYDNVGFSVVFPGPVETDMLKGRGKSLPFIHSPGDEARSIVEQVFKGKKQIEPSWFYAVFWRTFKWLPDSLVAKILG